MGTQPEPAKESAILELTEQLNMEINELQYKLDDSFERSQPEPSKDAEEGPIIPNVLDEVNQNLQFALGKVQNMHEFIVHAVIHKVHNN